MPKKTPPQSQTIAITIGDRTYDADQLTLGDIAELEEEFGQPFEEIDWRMKKAIAWLVWLVRRQEEPELTLQDVLAVRIVALAEEIGGERPTAPAAAAAGASSGGRRSKRSGSPGTSASTTSDPGSSPA